MDQNELARKHLERKLSPLRSIALVPPARGWLRAIREALGLTGAQLAARLGVVPSRIPALEKAEANGGTTLKTMREAAEAMGCTFVYAIVPTKPLDEMLRARAVALADAELARVHHTMRLEDQALDARDLADARERLVASYLSGNPRRLWDKL
ncbi:mobile mystery protein A [Agrobacterium rosae]|uniref:Mobile mystery protein A n=1 Tax=Agrobacterium rosae TaxID=1972867 RepID=A0A1R3U317_9HYPH|nr:mobile mystery protein A [Agrobacterium rosae]SCX35902.1 mobile mystery protein A [Agrobacterium rosae]